MEIAHEAVFANHGQNCCAGSRTFVQVPETSQPFPLQPTLQAEVYDEFVSLAAAAAKARVVGDPWRDGVQQGPQIDRAQIDKVLGFIEAGVAEGAVLECGGGREGERGFFLQPTVFSGVTDSMAIASQEIFGPVQSILKFSDLEEVGGAGLSRAGEG